MKPMTLNHISKKELAVGIILLFVGICIIPGSAKDIEKPQSSIEVQNPILQYPTAGKWTETQKLISPNETGRHFGISISLSGDTALIGQLFSEEAYVFTRNNNTWTQQTKLIPSDAPLDGNFGYSVSLDGDTALIGVPADDGKGSVYVFTHNGSNWTQQAKLLASDGQIYDYFGYSVSLSDDTALIGAFGDENHTGSAYVFIHTGTSWTQQAKLLALDGIANDWFGYSVSLFGDTALIGACAADDWNGSAYIFARTGSIWTQQTKLLTLDGATGHYGESVFLDESTAIIGTPYGGRLCSGSAYVFTGSNGTWAQQANLTANDKNINDNFGRSVCLDDDTALIGAPCDDDSKGSAYVFTRLGNTWMQQEKLLASDGEAHDLFGWSSVSLDGETALIGTSMDEERNGSVYVFTQVNLTFSIYGGTGVNLEITNNGIVMVTDVAWQMHVEGGILGRIYKTYSGTVDIIAGEPILVVTIELFGLGPITITAKVTDEEQILRGFQFIIFSIVK
jgi:hypothetical protein